MYAVAKLSTANCLFMYTFNIPNHFAIYPIFLFACSYVVRISAQAKSV